MLGFCIPRSFNITYTNAVYKGRLPGSINRIIKLLKTFPIYRKYKNKSPKQNYNTNREQIYVVDDLSFDIGCYLVLNQFIS